MKNLIITLSILFSSAVYSQFHIGASGAMDVENDIAKLGVGINYMVLPKVTLGAGLMITPFETDGDYEIMYNIKYNLGRFNIAAGLMDMKMQSESNMSMNMNMGMNMDMDMDMDGTEPYFGIEYKLFKNKNLKVFYNQSEMMKTIGIMTPIFNIGKKHMNHNMMDHDNMNHNMDNDNPISLLEKTTCDSQIDC